MIVPCAANVRYDRRDLIVAEIGSPTRHHAFIARRTGRRTSAHTERDRRNRSTWIPQNDSIAGKRWEDAGHASAVGLMAARAVR
jgi:hypothetical protein